MTRKRLTTRSRPTKWKHGANCYDNHGCRCQVCRDGKAAVMRDWRARRSAKR